MKYTVYKVTNKLNGKTYIGSHKTEKLDDGYMGSGKYLKRSIQKHGIENFEKEILFVFDDAESMFRKEAELVNEDYLSDGNTYNLKIGGEGGFQYINSNQKILTRRNRKIAKLRDYSDSEYLEKIRESSKTHITENFSKPKYDAFRNAAKTSFKGRKHSEETLRKMSEAHKRRRQQNMG